MSKLFKKIKKLFLFIILIACLFIAYLVYTGYNLYQEAIFNTSIEDKVKQIQSDQNYTSISKISQTYIDAVVAIEDHRFYNHHGIDFISLTRAIHINFNKKELDQGGSTITQQLAKNLFFSQEKKFTRKIAELFVAMDLEKSYSKNEILELYVNTVYFGNGYYGISKASNGYFSKVPIDLSPFEATYLAGIPNAPSIYSSSKHSDLAKRRHKIVLNAMVKYKKLSQEEADKIYSSNIP